MHRENWQGCRGCDRFCIFWLYPPLAQNEALLYTLMPVFFARWTGEEILCFNGKFFFERLGLWWRCVSSNHKVCTSIKSFHACCSAFVKKLYSSTGRMQNIPHRTVHRRCTVLCQRECLTSLYHTSLLHTVKTGGVSRRRRELSPEIKS